MFDEWGSVTSCLVLKDIGCNLKGFIDNALALLVVSRKKFFYLLHISPV